jgi:WXG100 family type VII secretion target
MANVNVDYEALERSAGQLRSGQQDMERKLGQLKSTIDDLVSSGFKTDTASGKFQESYDQWNRGAKNVVSGLDGMNSFLKRAISQHQDLDRTLGQSASAGG